MVWGVGLVWKTQVWVVGTYKEKPKQVTEDLAPLQDVMEALKETNPKWHAEMTAALALGTLTKNITENAMKDIIPSQASPLQV